MDDDLRTYLYSGSPFLPGIDFGLLNPIIRDMFLEEEYSLGEAIAKGLGLVGDSSAFSTLAKVGPENMAEYIKGFKRTFHHLLFVVMLQEVDISDIGRAIPILLAQQQVPEDQFFSQEDIAAAVPLMRAEPNGIMLINEFVRKELCFCQVNYEPIFARNVSQFQREAGKRRNETRTILQLKSEPAFATGK